MDVVAAGGPVADLAEFVAVLEPEGDLFGGGVFEVDREAGKEWGVGSGGWRVGIRSAGEDVATSIY